MPIDQLAAYNKPDREKVLYAGAKSEGKITWYTSLAGESYKQLAAAFETKYPGVKVESYRATRQEMSARIAAESQAQRYIVDTIETTIPLLKLLKENSMLVPYYFPTQAKFPDNTKEKTGKGLVFWAIDRESHIGLAYNKNSIASKLAPRNYDGLLRPELKDKIAFAGSDTGVTVIGAMLKFKGEEYVKKTQNSESGNSQRFRPCLARPRDFRRGRRFTDNLSQSRRSFPESRCADRMDSDGCRARQLRVHRRFR
jgi:iron(III) transport system substrate-binding protein